jgi:FkbM family methyltransferase
MKRAGEYWVPDQEEFMLESYERGGWQTSELDIVLSYVTNFKVAVDGGAHVGSWSLKMAKHFDKVWAFEPEPNNVACLKENIRNNHKIACLPVALGEVQKEVGLKLRAAGNTGSWKIQNGEETLMSPLDTFEFEDVGLLKTDCEGYDFWALLGAEETIKRCRPVIVYEYKRGVAKWYGKDGKKGDRCAEWLKERGYSFKKKIGLNFLWVPK